MKTWYKKGSWNAICDVCGERFKASELSERWDGLMVDAACFESRHPQDFLRVPEEHTETPWARPEPEDIFREIFCTIEGRYGTAGVGVAGCAVTGLLSPFEPYDSYTNWIYKDLEVAIAGVAITGNAVSGRVFSLAPES